MELIEGDAYVRAVAYRGLTGWISVEPHALRNALVVTLSESLSPRLPAILERVRRLFDLGAEPESIATVLGPLAEDDPGLRVPGAFDGFETSVRAILGQQVSVRFAGELAGRIVGAFGVPIQTPWPDVNRTFPQPREIAELPQERLGELGIIRTRSRAILELAERVANGSLRLEPDGDPDAIRRQLRAISGIGDWTADYIAMRCLSWPDAFPAGDLGVLKALNLKKPKEAIAASEAWRPWRAYAVMHLWRGLAEPKEPSK